MRPTRKYHGTLKMLCEVTGYGFIGCPDIRRVYKRDVFLPQGLVPSGARPGDCLAFTMELSPGGKPAATKVWIRI